MPYLHTRRAVALAALAVFCALAPAAPAHADTGLPVWKCRASAGYTIVGGGERAETIVANGNVGGAGEDPDRAVCGSSETGGGNLPSPLGIPTGLLAAPTASASTSVEPELGWSYEQRIGARARAASLTLRVPEGGEVTVGATAAQSAAGGSCEGGVPQLSGSSSVTGLTLAGVPIDEDALGPALASALSSLTVGVTSTANETIRGAGSLTVRALHIVVKQGAATILDAVLAESKVGFDGAVCSDLLLADGICPDGSLYSKRRGVCVIPPGSGGSVLGEILVGSPSDAPSGGEVIPLDVARKRFGNVNCLTGSAPPRFAVVDVKNRNVMTGSPGPDRMLGRGGNDRMDGTRGNDCIDGGRGADDLLGAKGNDRLFGVGGNDHLNGAQGSDFLSGGSGDDTINAGFGQDRAFGGPGRDYINIATAGKPAVADCGRGKDKVRFNNNERRRLRGCETKYPLKDR